jgi:hypothetical protein
MSVLFLVKRQAGKFHKSNEPDHSLLSSWQAAGQLNLPPPAAETSLLATIRSDYSGRRPKNIAERRGLTPPAGSAKTVAEWGTAAQTVK